MLFYLIGDEGPFIYKLDKASKYTESLGLPVLPYIINTQGKSHTLATYEQIGYICKEDSDKTEEVTIEWFNTILENEGKLMIEMDENKPFLLDGKVVLSEIIKEEELC